MNETIANFRPPLKKNKITEAIETNSQQKNIKREISCMTPLKYLYSVISLIIWKITGKNQKTIQSFKITAKAFLTSLLILLKLFLYSLTLPKYNLEHFPCTHRQFPHD